MSNETVGTAAVIRAVYDLHHDDEWPTIEAVASYLQTTTETAKRQLLELRRKRIMQDRRRGGERRWMPWGTP